MNKGYTYIDGKLIISDENGNLYQSEYYNNLIKMLSQENVIEEIESKIKKIKDENRLYSYCKEGDGPSLIYASVVFLALTTPAAWILTGTNPYISYVDTVFGPVNGALFYHLVAAASCLYLRTLKTFTDYNTYKKYAKMIEENNNEIEDLKLQLEKEKEALVILQEKTKDNKNSELIPIQLNDKEQLESIRNYLKSHYVSNSNEEKHYDETDVETTEKYMEKGPKLVKKK